VNSEDMKMNNLRQGNSGVIVLSYMYSSYMSHVNLIERVQNKKHKFFSNTQQVFFDQKHHLKLLFILRYDGVLYAYIILHVCM